MKKTILFALIALLFLAMFTGCRAYRRTAYTEPGHAVTNTDGRTTQGFQYRNDGYSTGDRVTRGHQRDSNMTQGQHSRHGSYHNYRHDGLVTDTDGIIGNGTFADRPFAGTNTTTHRGAGGMDGVTRGAGAQGIVGDQ